MQAFEVGYRTGTFVMPPPPPAEEEVAERRRAHRSARLTALREERREERGEERREERQRRAAARPAPVKAAPSVNDEPSPTPSPKPSPKPSATPAPKPSPTESAEPEPFEKKGPMTSCDGDNYCLGGTPLDLGPVATPGATAGGDYDLDGTVETNGDEVAGLLALDSVTMTVVEMEDGRLGIYSINAKAVS